MMSGDLKAAVLEIVEITKAVPEALQARCFEILLNHHLALQAPAKPAAKPEATAKDAQPAADDGATSQEIAAPSQDDIQAADLHLKARKFLEKYGLTVADLNEVLFKEGEEFKPLFDDLKTTKLSESQIRIGLVEALKNGIKSGDFQFDGEAVRAECQIRKCYDAANFSATFKNNASLFDGFEGYKKAEPIIRLSETGRKKLSDLIGELKD